MKLSAKEKQRKYYQWKLAVFELDGERCMNVLCRLLAVSAHHIIFRSQDKSGAYDVSNGIVLCPECHYKVHNGLGLRSKTTGRQFMIKILEQHKDNRWQKSYEILKSKE